MWSASNAAASDSNSIARGQTRHCGQLDQTIEGVWICGIVIGQADKQSGHLFQPRATETTRSIGSRVSLGGLGFVESLQTGGGGILGVTGAGLLTFSSPNSKSRSFASYHSVSRCEEHGSETSRPGQQQVHGSGSAFRRDDPHLLWYM